MWTNEQIEQAQTRAALCESVALTRDSYLELLDTARSSNDTALLAKGAVALGAERTMEADRLRAGIHEAVALFDDDAIDSPDCFELMVVALKKALKP